MTIEQIIALGKSGYKFSEVKEMLAMELPGAPVTAAPSAAETPAPDVAPSTSEPDPKDKKIAELEAALASYRAKAVNTASEPEPKKVDPLEALGKMF